MQLNTKDGIGCDYCGAVFKIDFSYYSFDFKYVKINAAVQLPPLQHMLKYPTVLSVDICPQCADNIKKVVIDNYSKMITAKPRAKEARCEWSGKKLLPNSDSYYCVVTKVVVKMTGQPSTCNKCGMNTFDIEKPCQKCSNNNFSIMANISSDSRDFEMHIGDDGYNHFMEKIQTVRKMAGEWVTKS